MYNKQTKLLNTLCPINLLYPVVKPTLKHKFPEDYFNEQLKLLREAILANTVELQTLAVLNDKVTAGEYLNISLQELGNYITHIQSSYNEYIGWDWIHNVVDKYTLEETILQFKKKKSLYNYLQVYYYFTYNCTKQCLENINEELRINYIH